MKLIPLAATCALALAILFPGSAPAVDEAASRQVTYYRDVMPIVQEHCLVCHRPGGNAIAGMVAPMSFMNYKETRPWAKSIARLVQAREMPPWDASADTAGHFMNERVLTQDQIDTIVRWVSTGARRGNEADAPADRVFEDTGGWIIGKPDLIVRMPEPYLVEDDVQDVQPRFTIMITEEMVPEPIWIQAIEYKPDSEVVHHITGRATAPAIEGHDEETFTLGSIAAGEDPTMYPEGFGNLLRAGTELTLGMHYHKESGPGTATYDQSSIGFKFHAEGVEIKHKVNWSTVSNNNFQIPPGQTDWLVGSGRTFADDTLVLSIHPHMHFRGKSMKYTAFYPDGTNELLIDVPRYDYNWQINYIYNEPKFLPKGTRVEVRAIFDNSERTKNLYPEVNIERTVEYGAASTDEMMNPFLAWTAIDPEDAKPYYKAAGIAQPGAE